MVQNLKDPKDKANELILLALSINADIKKAKHIASKIASHIYAGDEPPHDYIFNVRYYIDKIDI